MSRMQRSRLGTTGLGLCAAVACASLTLLACSSEADNPNWWADEDGGSAGGAGGQPGTGASAGSGGTAGTGGDPGTAGAGGDPGTAGTGGSAGSSGGSGGSAGGTASDDLTGYWLWEDRVAGNTSLGFAHLNGQARMRMAFGANNTCHYIWNETTGSDFHTPCTYTISGDMVTYTATADPDGTAFGYSCTHPDWESWNDRPAVEYGKYKFVGDRLYLGVNAYWGFGGDVTTSDGAQIPKNGSCKRFGYWESLNQAMKEETWIVYKPVTKQEWESAGAGSCAACATYPAAAVCQ